LKYFLFKKEKVFSPTNKAQKALLRTHSLTKAKMNSAYNKKMTTTTTTTTKQPFCKVCYDAGKNESVYTSHFVKDKQGSDGKVVCPYLLSLTCTFCKKSEGHTARHCPILQKKMGTQQQQQDKQEHKQQAAHKEKEDDGWSKVVGTTKRAPAIHRAPGKKTTTSSTGAAKYANTLMLATLMEQEEQRVIKDEIERVDKEVKRVKFDTDFPAFEKKANKTCFALAPKPATLAPATLAPATLAPATLALALVPSKEESCYGTYSTTSTAISWGDDDDDY